MDFVQSRLLGGRREADGTTFTKLWEIEIVDVHIHTLRTVGDDVLALGCATGTEESYEIMKYDTTGTRLWHSPWMFSGHPLEVLIHEDQSYTILADTDTHLQLIRCSTSGELSLLTQVAKDGYSLQLTELFQEGYILCLKDANHDHKLIQLDHNGNIVNSFAANAEDGCYRFTNMLVYGKQAYLSGYILPRNLTSDDFPNWKIEYFTAVLFVYDLETGLPEEFFTVQNSVGLELTVKENGNVDWQTGYVFDCVYRQGSGMDWFSGLYLIFEYTFTPEGELVAQRNTWTRNSFYGLGGPGSISFNR